jgi:hypothetical protein
MTLTSSYIRIPISVYSTSVCMRWDGSLTSGRVSGTVLPCRLSLPMRKRFLSTHGLRLLAS